MYYVRSPVNNSYAERIHIRHKMRRGCGWGQPRGYHARVKTSLEGEKETIPIYTDLHHVVFSKKVVHRGRNFRGPILIIGICSVNQRISKDLKRKRNVVFKDCYKNWLRGVADPLQDTWMFPCFLTRDYYFTNLYISVETTCHLVFLWCLNPNLDGYKIVHSRSAGSHIWL